jgi:hypothetical protein
LLDTFTSEQQSLELVFPGKRPLDTHASRMDRGVEEPLAPTLGALAVTGILCDVGDHAGIEKALSIRHSIKAAIEIARGPSEVQPDLCGHLFQRLQALGYQDHVCFVDRSHGDRREDRAMIVDDSDDFLPLLMFVARVAKPIAPFFATVLVPSPWSTRRSSCFSTARGRTLATNACQSEPSSAHRAKTL